MHSKIFGSLEIDAIGEILNISLGASATAVSAMLNKRVDITTPSVQVLSCEEFEFTNLEPAVAVEITYISGLKGKNIMLLKRHDVKVIVEILMGTHIPDEDFELDEMNISAICEVMNQMMGSSATALSEFLGEAVNISTPVSFEIEDPKGFKKKYFPDGKTMVVVRFILKIENMVESEFLNVMSIDLAKRLLSAFSLEEKVAGEKDDGINQDGESNSNVNLSKMSQNETENHTKESRDIDMSNDIETPSRLLSQEEIEKMLRQNSAQLNESESAMQQQPVIEQPVMQQPMYANLGAKMVNVQPMIHSSVRGTAEIIGDEQAENLALIMEVPLEISVEIGKTKKLVREILKLTQGSLVVLDKLAGEQVDLYVNNQCIAKGDVVVVDDNFGVRITEIIKKVEI